MSHCIGFFYGVGKGEHLSGNGKFAQFQKVHVIVVIYFGGVERFNHFQSVVYFLNLFAHILVVNCCGKTVNQRFKIQCAVL